MSLENHLKSAFGLTFEALYERDGLIKLNQKFQEFVGDYQELDLIKKSRLLEDFLVELFDIKSENDELKKRHADLQKIYVARREFVQRNVSKKYSNTPSPLAGLEALSNDSKQSLLAKGGWGDGFQILKDLQIAYEDIDELEKTLAAKILAEENLDVLENYAAWALYSPKGKALHKNGALFILPQKIDHQNLVTPCFEKSKRDGFNLTDNGFGLNRVLAESHYCIFCHKQEKDSCRKGIVKPVILSTAKDLGQKEEILCCAQDDGVKKSQDDKFKTDPLGIKLHGCPLDEKISEMNLLKSEGFSLAALAVAAVDNPMIAGTGHRICNDCMKSCIYQKQDAVDVPQIETRTLKDVLSLPYGFEIYSLLTRWNPLSEKKFTADATGKKVLVAGLGPAGYTLAHHLLNDGHQVVAIDGLKIEPLNPEISGIDEFGNRQKFRPIKFLDEIYEPLSKRLIHGFGGVAEYGITVRFDKNFLKVIRLLLERRSNFRMFGGLRFGSSITDEVAFKDCGFDHVALCIGAGRPNIINLKNNFAKGVRAASDFLMSLQLTGSFKEELFTNLQIRMPIAVIGGGLTAVDSACEAQAYYVVQIKKFAKKVAAIGKENLWKELNSEEKIIAEEFLTHARELENGDAAELLKKWGGIKILYRKRIQDSPAYKLNHQELNKAFEEGVEFVENITPLEVEVDEFDHVKGLKCSDEKYFNCKSLLIAAGTSPNISPVVEDGLDFELDGKYFRSLGQGSVITKIDQKSKKAVSFFGDLHPDFEGNVVKAMASAKLGYPQISKILRDQKNTQIAGDFLQKINSEFSVRIERVEELSDHVVEIFIKAPLLAKQSQIGQIFRLQNYHALAPKIGDQILAMEGVPVTALSIDRENGIISGIVLGVGASTSLIKNFKAGEPCVFMGPSGKPTEIPNNETVVLIGGGRGNQPLTAIAEAYRENGCKVFFFAGYRSKSFIVRKERMENSCDVMVFAVEEDGDDLEINRDQDVCFKGSAVAALQDYFTKNPQKIDRIFTIGNNQMMHEISKLRHRNLVKSISEAPIAITSLNSPMQCMLKGVCSQCLQKRENGKGEMEYFYSCAEQDQNMDKFNFEHLHNRCAQNSLSEKVVKNSLFFRKS